MVLRILAVLIVVPAVYFFIYWVPFSFTSLHDTAVPSIVSLICAIAAGIQVWKLLGDGAKHVAHYAALGAVVCGGVGFVGGFFGPMIFAPGANQGPLLGLFITGPLGFLLGGVAGTLYGLVKRRSMAAD